MSFRMNESTQKNNVYDNKKFCCEARDHLTLKFESRNMTKTIITIYNNLLTRLSFAMCKKSLSKKLYTLKNALN